MKKFLLLTLILTMLFTYIPSAVSANNEINLTIDGILKTFDVMPVTENSHTLVPLRGIFEELGFKVSWDSETQAVKCTRAKTEIAFKIGNDIANKNETEIALDVPAKIIASRTMIPLSFISKAFGYKTEFSEDLNSVIIKRTEVQKMLDGKKVIFIGNSHIYRGLTVIQKGNSILDQESRSNDTGYFYQLCKANGCDVSVTNWTFGSHGTYNLFGTECPVKGECNGVKHEEYLTDKYYDYVFINSATTTKENAGTLVLDDIDYIMNFFKEANPNVKFILLGNASSRGINAKDTEYTAVTETYPTIAEKGVIIADWGKIVKGIILGELTVPGAEKTYNKNSFVVSDGFHPNMLAGYITTLAAYCTITGESAVGQPYDFWNIPSLNDRFDSARYIKDYYKNDATLTNFPEIFESEADMEGIQKLIDEHLQNTLSQE